LELNILLKIAIIFLFFTVVDICGHFIFKTKRNVPEWLLTIGVVLAFAGTTFLGVRVYFTDAEYLYGVLLYERGQYRSGGNPS